MQAIISLSILREVSLFPSTMANFLAPLAICFRCTFPQKSKLIFTLHMLFLLLKGKCPGSLLVAWRLSPLYCYNNLVFPDCDEWIHLNKKYLWCLWKIQILGITPNLLKWSGDLVREPISNKFLRWFFFSLNFKNHYNKCSMLPYKYSIGANFPIRQVGGWNHCPLLGL
jgi:hypothetical protein